MAISSIVVVADRETIEGGGVELGFTPGDAYPIRDEVALSVQDQPFPLTGPPTRVVPAIVGVRLRYGRLSGDQQPPAFQPDEHAFRELWVETAYVQGSWQASGKEATLAISILGGLRDNTPSGEQAEPDDPFAVYLNLQALCIWTEEVSLLDRLAREARDIGGRLRAP